MPYLVETSSSHRFLTLEYSPDIRLDLENLGQYLCAPVGGAERLCLSVLGVAHVRCDVRDAYIGATPAC